MFKLVTKAPRSILQKIKIKLTHLLPDKSIAYSKDEWNKLAEENHRYYIASKRGRNIDEAEFSALGEENYQEHIASDELLKKHLGDFSDKRVLEIGCGVGRVTESIAKHFKEVEAIDISEKMIEKASERLSHVSNLHFTATDGEHYPFEDESFDFVFSYIVFQHMPSVEVIEENFKEIKRVLKPNGIAKIQIRGGEIIRKNTWNYGPSFNKDAAQEMMDRVGLKVVQFGDDSIKRFFLWLKKS